MKNCQRFFMRNTAFILLFIMLLCPGTAHADDIVIKEGTEVLLKVLERMKSGVVKQGTIVKFLVEKAVKDENGVVLIEDDAIAYGTVVTSTSAGMMGTSGKLEFTVDYVEGYNGVEIPLRGSRETQGTSSTGAVVVGTLFVSVLSVFFRGDNAVVESGTIFPVYVNETTVLSEDIEPVVDPQIDRKLDAHFGIVTTADKTPAGGLPVLEVAPGGPAAAAGMRKGDELMKIDSYDIASNDVERLAAYVKLRFAQGAAVKATVARDGKPQVMELRPLP